MIHRRLNLLFRFMAGQSAIQILNFFAAFLVMRWIDVAAFAQYSLAFAFQGTMATLIDGGLAGSIIALVGRKAHEPATIGRYVSTAKQFRSYMFFCVSSIASFIYWLISGDHGWSTSSRIAVFAAVVFATGVQLFSIYSAPLLICRELHGYYRPQIFAAGLRVAAISLLFYLGMLSAPSATWIGAFAIAWTGWQYRKAAQPLIKEPGTSSAETKREMLSYIAPLAPGVIFAAFQVHISVALITLFGNTRSIAEVGALGRLGQLFVLLTALNSALVAPYIAKVPYSSLFRSLVSLIGLQIAGSVVITFTAFLAPWLLLWILGPRYQNLRDDVGWVVLYSCIGYVAQGLWTINNARKWLFWWSSIACIPFILATQVTCALLVDLRTTRGVIEMNVAANCATVILHLATTLYGYIRDCGFESCRSANESLCSALPGQGSPQNVEPQIGSNL